MIGWTLRSVVAVVLAVIAAQMMGVFDGSVASRMGALKGASSSPKPAAVQSGSSREIHIASHESGHYLVDAAVNGTEVPFLIDTGASWVTLTRADAERAGIETEWLDYDVRMQTANGIVRAARIYLDELRVGEMELREVQAMVSDSSMGISLLGMNFLERLDGYEVREETLILRW